MKRVLKIIICCVLIVVVLASTFLVSSAYSVEQGSYGEVTYTPKYIFDLNAYVGEDANPNLHKLKTYLYSSAFNTGLPTYQTRYPESLDAYYGGAQYGFKTDVNSVPGGGLNDYISTSYVSLSNQYWNATGTIFDPFYFGNAYKYVLQTSPGVIDGFDVVDYNALFNDYISFCFLIPQKPSYLDEEFEFSSYCDLTLDIYHTRYNITDDNTLSSMSYVQHITFDDGSLYLDSYAVNVTDEAPLYDETPLSQDYALAFVDFYPARYLYTRVDDIYDSDDIETMGLLYSDFRIEVSMTIDSTAIDFSYSNVGDAIESSYSHFVEETGSVPIYSVSSYMRGIDGDSHNRFISSVLGTSGAIDAGDGVIVENLDFVSWLGDTVFGVLSVEFVPGISIANILYVILGLGVLFLIIKYFAGG